MREAEANIETATEKDVLRVLRQVNDPEVGVNIVDLGLIYSTDISGRRVRIAMTMTTPACPMHSYLTEEVRAVLLDELEGLDAVEVQLVWEPPWSPAMISEAGKRQLGWR
jgi:metal-sulfur cluster biosynthetic enzyme